MYQLYIIRCGTIITFALWGPMDTGDKVDCCRNRQQIGNKVDCRRYGPLCCRSVAGSHWRQSWIQHGRLCGMSTKSTLSLWLRTHWHVTKPTATSCRIYVVVDLLNVPATKLNVADLLPVSPTVDFQQSRPFSIQLCCQCVPGLRG